MSSNKPFITDYKKNKKINELEIKYDASFITREENNKKSLLNDFITQMRKIRISISDLRKNNNHKQLCELSKKLKYYRNEAIKIKKGA
jgi:hypothetical protein